MRFRSPPWLAMGSAAALCGVDLSSGVCGDLEVASFVRDVPDFFYKLLLPEALWPYFGFDGVTGGELRLHLRKLGRQNLVERLGGRACACLRVLPMGFA